MSSTATRGDPPGAALEAAGEAGPDGGADDAGAVDAGAVEAGGALVGVPAVDVLAAGGEEAAADDTATAEVDALACLELELHAAANDAIATRAVTCR